VGFGHIHNILVLLIWKAQKEVDIVLMERHHRGQIFKLTNRKSDHTTLRYQEAGGIFLDPTELIWLGVWGSWKL
jgi:hypothetical protein